MHCLGNDVVDLREPHNRRSAANPRFAARVLTQAEQRAARRLPDRVRERWLWACWSAKEAAYKALSRQRPALVFAQNKFLVSMDAGDAARLFKSDDSGTATGTVSDRKATLPVTWQWTPEWIHCLLGAQHSVYRVNPVADAGKEPAPGPGMSRESSAVRALAGRLLTQAGIHDVRIERRPTPAGRPGAPLATRNGEPVPGCTISLSHDGRFVAAAVSVQNTATTAAGSACR